MLAMLSLVFLPKGKEFYQLENQGTQDELIQSDHILNPNATV